MRLSRWLSVCFSCKAKDFVVRIQYSRTGQSHFIPVDLDSNWIPMREDSDAIPLVFLPRGPVLVDACSTVV